MRYGTRSCKNGVISVNTLTSGANGRNGRARSLTLSSPRWRRQLQSASVVVPVTYADKAVDHRLADYQPVSDMDKAVHAEYDPEVYHGAPVAVQIIGRRLSEERTLAIAEYIGKLLGH